jgi:flavodoxin I
MEGKMAAIKVIYGSNSGNTERAAMAIANQLGADCVNISNAAKKDFEADLLILGTSTWGIGELQDDWLSEFDLLNQIDFNGRKVALFGLGDQFGFADSFIDGVGTLYQKVIEHNAAVIGMWSKAGYEHHNSTAEFGDNFVGLALDDDNEPEKSEERITKWCKQLRAEAAL